jgi:hypothetical protein
MRIDPLQVAAREKVERTGLRAVAREMGLSAPSLSRFLEGSCPREATLRKIREWYFSEAAARVGDVSPEAARTAVGCWWTGCRSLGAACSFAKCFHHSSTLTAAMPRDG